MDSSKNVKDNERSAVPWGSSYEGELAGKGRRNFQVDEGHRKRSGINFRSPFPGSSPVKGLPW